MTNDLLFILGMTLIILNFFVGYGGIIIAAFFFKKTKKRYFITLGAFVYIFSWLMLIGGTILTGPKGYKLAKSFVKDNLLLTLIIILIVLAIWLIHNNFKKTNHDKENSNQ